MWQDLRNRITLFFCGREGIFFLAALLVYLPGIWWGVTPAVAGPVAHPWGTDELAPLQAVTELYGIFFAHQPHFNPQYPPVQNVVQALFMAPYLLFLWLTGGLSHPQPLYPFGFADPVAALRTTTYLARAASWLMAAGAVAIAYRTGVVLRDRRFGTIAALLALFLLPMVYYARVSNVDMGALFWTALGLYVFALCLRNGVTRRRLIFLAVLAAVATATKDASWPAFFMMAVVIAWRELRSSTGAEAAGKIRSLGIAFAVAVATYLIASGVVFRPSRFIAHLHWITGPGLPPTWREAPTLNGYLILCGKIAANLLESMGVPAALCVAAGLLLCAFRKRLPLVWTLPAAGIVLFVLFPARYVMLRFVIVIAYGLIFFAAVAIREAYDSPGLRRVAPMLLVAVAGWEALRAADLTWQMIHDSRYAAGVWLKNHARPGDRILHFALPPNLPPLERGVRNVMAPLDGSYRFTRAAEDPEFAILIPFSFIGPTPAHESNLAESEYDALVHGGAGYEEVTIPAARHWFAYPTLSWVNPPARLFVRRDLLSRR